MFLISCKIVIGFRDVCGSESFFSFFFYKTYGMRLKIIRYRKINRRHIYSSFTVLCKVSSLLGLVLFDHYQSQIEIYKQKKRVIIYKTLVSQLKLNPCANYARFVKYSSISNTHTYLHAQ